ncbi:MAG: hypothetical protein ACREBD_32575, partial [Blastocatellia bacterium]
LKGFFDSPAEMSQYLSEADEAIREKQELLKSLEKEHQRVKQEMDQVYRLYIDGGLNTQGFGVRNRPLEERFNQLENEIPELQGDIDYLKISFLSSDKILTDAQTFYASWQTLDFNSKRQVVENIVDRITIGKDDVTVELCYLPSSAKEATHRQRNLRDSSPLQA